MKVNTLEGLQCVHFVGVGGIGVSALARLMHSRGARVSGSDAVDSELLHALQSEGILAVVGHRRDNVPEDTELLVYSSAVPEDNPERVYARERGLPCLDRGAFLGLVSESYCTIAVAGTHGKTTTTAMLAKVLSDAGLKPTVLVGSLLAETGTNFLPGESVETPEGPRRYLVVEACEYRRAFLALMPSMVVVTNIEEDHLDYYKDINDIERAFFELVARLPREGVCVTTQDVVHRLDRSGKRFGVEQRARMVAYEESDVAGVRLRVPGKHNIENARAVLVAARALGISRERAVSSLNDFQGTWRRFEYKGRISGSGARVYDDYAHHPSEIRATLQGVREVLRREATEGQSLLGARIFAIFQPHLFSRTRQLLASFAESFGDADEVLLTDIYAAREENDGSIHSRDLVEAIKKHHARVHYVGGIDRVAGILETETAPEDIVVLMGAGDVGEAATKLGL